MNEQEFMAQADAMLARIEEALDRCGGDFDYELGAGGVLELSFEDGSKIIVNRHGAAREIWVAARSGGYHFKPEGERWINTRDGSELLAALARCIEEQSGEAITLA